MRSLLLAAGFLLASAGAQVTTTSYTTVVVTKYVHADGSPVSDGVVKAQALPSSKKHRARKHKSKTSKVAQSSAAAVNPGMLQNKAVVLPSSTGPSVTVVESPPAVEASPDAAPIPAAAPVANNEQGATSTATSQATPALAPAPSLTNTESAVLPTMFPYQVTPTAMYWTPMNGSTLIREAQTSVVYTFGVDPIKVNGNTIPQWSKTTINEPACTPAPEALKQEMLQLHNDYRRTYNRNPVVWDDSIACPAQRQAAQCAEGHMTYIDGANYMQNIAGATFDKKNGLKNMFSLWTNEAYDQGGHWQQVVGDHAVSIGCATLGNNGCRGMDWLICNYWDGGV